MSRHGRILTILCFVDWLSTVILIKTLHFEEWNFVVRYYFEIGGLPGLTAAKIFINGSCVFVFEAVLKFELMPPEKMAMYYRAAIGAYAIFFPALIFLAKVYF